MAYDPERHHFLAFFRAVVLAEYREQPDKYELRNDNFEGTVTLTHGYYAQLNDAQKESEYLDVRFGYRTLKTGDLCIAIFKHDLTQKSEGHIARWLPHLLDSGDWVDYAEDDRFSLWFRRYAEGDWDVDNGRAFYLVDELKYINGLTMEVVGCRLYDVADDPLVIFPAAQNTWRYEDAHVTLYGILIDGLSMPCIRALAVPLKTVVDPQATRAVRALKRILPPLETDTTFTAPIDNVSIQRGNASHGVRPVAQPMRAFETFSTDLEQCLDALRVVRSLLERELGKDAKRSRQRQEAMKYLPTIVNPAGANDSISAALAMAGKTVDKVEAGSRHDIQGVHQSEAIIVHFSDGSIMAIDTGSNAANLRCERHRPEDFHVDFRVHWVPKNN